MKKHSCNNSAFTIIELIVVMVVIAVLAAITILSYTGITAKADSAAIKSELEGASKQLALFQTTNDYYPITNNCVSPESSTNICLKLNTKYSYTYTPNNNTNPTGYVLYSSYNNTGYNISNTSSLTITANLAEPSSCPSGFISVPGSATYNTSGFCVMKYEAKADNNGDGIGDTIQTAGYNTYDTYGTWPANIYPISSSRKLVSSAAGYPVTSVSQTTAMNAAANYTADNQGNTITGAHLITEAEWMTIAQNVLSVASNWSGGSVGSGYVYSGHNDNSPSKALEASSDDNNGYYGTEDYKGDSGITNYKKGDSQRRTLTLSNGEVIWDMSGNVYDLTSGQTTNGNVSQPGIKGRGYDWREYTAITTTGSLSVNVFPSSTGISGSNSWTSTNGIGKLYSNADETKLSGIVRGGDWILGDGVGVLSLLLHYNPDNTPSNFGFRVAVSAS